MELFIHGRSGLTTVDPSPETTIGEVARGVAGADAQVWVEGASEPFDPAITVASTGLADGAHVHVGTCPRVTAEVSFNTIEKTDTFPPAAAARAVLSWAAGPKGFDLSPEQRATHTLIVCGSDRAIDLDEHIGSFASDECRVCLELVPTSRFEG
jgi:hypothetical protein